MKIWKSLKYWQKWGIVFGIAHIILLSIIFIENSPKFEYLVVCIIELPLSFLSRMSHEAYGTDFFKSLWFFNKYIFYIVGTLSYMLVGAILGLIIDVLILTFSQKEE